MSARARVIAALGLVQILAWGSTVYLLAVLSEPIAAETGWRLTWVSAGIAVGLFSAGMIAAPVGRAIQARGGRAVMRLGILGLALGLSVLAAAPSLGVYLAAWALMGVAMAASLYEAAFSTLTQLYRDGARGAITQLTLWGGFASTLCWPLSAALVEALGWRGTCLFYAAVHLAVSWPLLGLVPRGSQGVPTARHGQATSDPGWGDLRLWLLILSGLGFALIFTILSIHLITLLTAGGRSLAAAVALGALIGPAQVGARVGEMALGQRHHPIWTQAVAALCVLVGIGALAMGAWAGAALVAYGAGTGLQSIARGTLPLALFGPATFPVMVGRIAGPVFLAAATAPVLGALLIEQAGAQATLWVLAGIALVPCGAALALARVARGA